MVRLGLANNSEEATPLLMKEAKPATTAWLNATIELSDLEEKLTDEAAAEARCLRQRAQQHAGRQRAGAAAAMGTAIWLTRSITVPIGQALAVAQTVAQGDLSSRIG